MPSTELPEFLWGNRDEPLYAAHPTVHRTPPLPLDDALRGLRSGWRFFAPVPRVSSGSKKSDCAPYFDALWVDIDRQPGVDPDDLLSDAKLRLPDDLWPSAVVFSGKKGIHLHWKLESDLPIETVEDYNRHFIRILDADNCYDRTRFLRHPGTVHPDTGRMAEIIDFSGKIHVHRSLPSLMPSPEALAAAHTCHAIAADGTPDWLAAANTLTGWGPGPTPDLTLLPRWQQRYLYRRPAKGWRSKGKSRSEVEQSIVYRLTGRTFGASDAHITEIADKYFAKHREEKPKQGYAYLERTISSARRRHFEKGWITHPAGGSPRKASVQHRAATVDDLEEYLGLIDGQPLSEWIAQVQAMGPSRATAYRHKNGLLGAGLATVTDDHRIVRLT